MVAVPTAPRIAVGEPWTSTKWNLMADAIDFIQNPPAFAGRHAVSGTFTSGAWTSVQLDTEDLDSYNGHSTTTNTSRYVSQASGWYHAYGTVAFASNATGLRGACFYINASYRLRKQLMTAVSGAVHNITTAGLIYLAAGEYVELQGYQTSGGLLAADGTDHPTLQVQWSRA